MSILRRVSPLLRAAGLLLILYLCLGAQQQFLNEQSESGYLWLGAAGALAFFVILPMPRLNLATRDAGSLAITPGVWRWLGAILLLFAFILLADSVRLFHAQLLLSPSVSSATWLEYGGGLVMALVGALLVAGVGRLPRADITMLMLVGILALAVFLRVYHLSDLPFGVWYDEGLIGLHVRNMLQNGAFRPVFIDNASFPLLTMFAYGLQTFGLTNVAGMRIVPATLATIGVFVAYLIGRELRGAWFGLAMALIATVMRWSIDFSRFGTTGIETVTFSLLTFYTAIRFVRNGRLRDVIWFGVALASGFYFYRAYQVQLIGVGIYLLLSYPFLRRRWTRSLMLILAAAVTTVIVLLPVGVFAIARADEFFGRVGQVSIFNESLPAGQTVQDAILQNTIKHLEMFHLRGDFNGRHNLPGAPMLDPVMGSLMVIGLFVALREWRKEHLLFFISLVVGLASGILSVSFEAPQAARSMSAITGIAYFSALGLTGMTSTLIGLLAVVLRDRRRTVARGLAGAVALAAVVLMSAWNIDMYFNKQRVDLQVWQSHSTDATLTARFYRNYGDETQFFVSPLIGIPPSMEFIAGDVLARSQAIIMPDPVPLRIPSTTHAVIMLLPSEDQYVDYMHTIYPNAIFTPVRPYDYGIDADPAITLFTVIELMPSDIGSIQGLQEGVGVLYVPQYDAYTFTFAEGVSVEIDNAAVENGTAVQLAEGNHRMTVDPADAAVSWQYALLSAPEPIPQYNLYHDPVTPNGLLATFYATGDWQGEVAAERIIPDVFQYIHVVPMGRPYSVRYTGYLYAPATGDYTFSLEARDTGALDIDGTTLLEVIPERSGTTTFHLEQGWHPIEVRHQDLTNATSIYLRWIPPGATEFDLITRDYLCPEISLCPVPGTN